MLDLQLYSAFDAWGAGCLLSRAVCIQIQLFRLSGVQVNFFKVSPRVVTWSQNFRVKLNQAELASLGRRVALSGGFGCGSSRH